MKNIVKIILVSKPLYRILGLISFLIVASSILELASPLLSKQIVDTIVAQTSKSNGNLDKLIFLVVLTFGLNLVSIAISGLSD